MPEPILQSMLCPILIGRNAQLAALTRLLDQACTGHGQIALVSGEAGIGKSRLVAELKSLATKQGFTVWQGNCFESDRVLPYGPWLDLLRSVQMQDALPAEWHTSVGKQPIAAESDPVQTKRRRFEWLTTLLLAGGANKPLRPRLLVVEDLHWCDDLSCEFLLHLARRSAQQPLLLLLTYRDDEVNTRLGWLLSALDREHLAQEIKVARLSVAETAGMLQAVFALNRAPQSDFLTALYELTEGNPFFVEEVLKACVAEGAIFQTGGQWGRKPLNQISIPRTVHLAVQQRVTQLTAAAQRLLTLAAVAGQRFDFDLLLQASGETEVQLIALLNELRAAQLLIEEAPDHFRFRHALTQQALYNGLLARERRRLHRSVAETLEAMRAPVAHASVLAGHFEAAAHWEKTLHYALQAGEQAKALQSPYATVEQLSRALRAAQQLALPLPLAVLQARGQALEMLGDFEAACADLEAVLTGVQAAADQPATWQALLDLGFLWTSRNFEQAGTYFQQALTLARALGDASMLAHTLNRIGNWQVNMGQAHTGRAYHEEALTLFHALHDQAGVAATLDLLAGATHFGGDLRLGMAYYQQAAKLFRALGDRRALASSLAWLAFQCATTLNLMVVLASPAHCLQTGEEARQMACELQWRPGEAFALIALAFVHGVEGNYGQALALASEALTSCQELQHGWATVANLALGALYLDLGDFQNAQRTLHAALTLSQQLNLGFGLHNATALLALALLHQGALAQAAALLTTTFGEPLVPNQPEAWAALMLKDRLYWWVRAELALAAGDAQLASTIAAGLVIAAQRGDDAAPIAARLWLLRGQAEFAQQQLEQASTTLQRAQQAASAQAARPVQWRSLAILGQLHQQQGDHATAETLFAAARDLISALATTLPAPQQQSDFLTYAFSQLPPLPAFTPLRAAKAAFDGLTEREREIAGLIAQGKSDRAIAEALILSKRTVSTHVSNILNKLGYSARSQVATWAAGKKLIGSEAVPHEQ